MQKRQCCTWGTVFHRFLAKEEQRRECIVKICRKNTPIYTNTCVCGAHLDGGKRQDNFPFLQDGVLVTVFVSHSFSCFNDLKMGNTISMATRMVSFDLVFHKLSENVSFVELQQGEHGFSF